MGPESKFEKEFREDIESMGGECIKFKASEAGWMDRIVLMPYGKTHWVELKRPDGKGKVSKLQKYQKKRLINLGHNVWTIETEKEKADFLWKLNLEQSDGI